MRRSDPSGTTGEEPTVCRADGPVPPTAGVLRALERSSARYVELAPRAADPQPFLVLIDEPDHPDTPAGDDDHLSTTLAADTAGAVESTSVSITLDDITAYPELQNAIAYYGPETKSVRVQTHPHREHVLAAAIDSFVGQPGSAFEYADRRFGLRVDRD